MQTETGRRPRGEMRERILDVALALFTEQGYDTTSLREIAERLGVTKAALYYHFERKEDILLELHLRLHDLVRDIFERIDQLEDGREIVAAWPGLLDDFIDQVVASRDLFLLHQRNEQAFHKLEHSEQNDAQHDDLQARFRLILGNPAIPLEQRVRMASSIGAVFGALMAAGGIFGDDVSVEEVARLAREAARDLLGTT